MIIDPFNVTPDIRVKIGETRARVGVVVWSPLMLARKYDTRIPVSDASSIRLTIPAYIIDH